MAIDFTRQGRYRFVRTVGAIAGKDIVDGLRNKTTLTMMLGVALIMFAAGALPLLLTVSGTQRLLLFDGAHSQALAMALRDQEQVRAGAYPDPAALRAQIGEASDAVVGVVLPADWGTAAAGELLVAPAYVPYWVDGERTAQAVAAVTAALEAALARPLRLVAEPVYPGWRPGGQPLMLGMSFVMVLFLVSVLLVPLLLIEERENHTLDMLLVSPVSLPELALGKALAGLTFGLAAAAVYLAFNHAFIVNWGIVALAALTGAFFATCLGLLLGLLFENQGTLNLWMGAVLLLLLAPMLLGLLPSAPDALVAAADWMPTAGLLRLFWQALSVSPIRGDLARNLIHLLVGAVLLLALIQLRLRRLDR